MGRVKNIVALPEEVSTEPRGRLENSFGDFSRNFSALAPGGVNKLSIERAPLPRRDVSFFITTGIGQVLLITRNLPRRSFPVFYYLLADQGLSVFCVNFPFSRN